jgi:hypothetical protein
MRLGFLPMQSGSSSLFNIKDDKMINRVGYLRKYFLINKLYFLNFLEIHQIRQAYA